MNEETLKKIYQLLEHFKDKEDAQEKVLEIRQLLENEDYQIAIKKLGELTNAKFSDEGKQDIPEDNSYPSKLSDNKLEETYIGLLLNDVKQIAKYYFLFDDCYFESADFLNIYKRVLFTEGQAYASPQIKENFNFARNSDKTELLMKPLKRDYKTSKENMETTHLELRKLFELRKQYLKMPIKNIQEKILEIPKYKLYSKMTVQEVKNAIDQITITNKFKQAVLNKDLTSFLKKGENNLTNGLAFPFPILSNVFKGIRKGETMAIAMPSNSGKSRFTIGLAAFTALVHKKKVLIISNEMSEEKMRLCLITTIINHPEIQKLHGNSVSITEGELLEYKFRPDKSAKVKLDKHGYVLKEEKETHAQFIERLSTVSSDYNMVTAITDWISAQMENSIYFMNITDHTNDELRKVIMNYYYREEIEYVFYDTLKTDIDNIHNPEEIKRTATILANLAQTFELFICSTLQLAETITSPVNLNVNDLAVSRTVKEVLDTLTLVKQINVEHLGEYEYSLKETDTEFFELEKSKNPDVRHYACVVDKNRAGAKPTVLFRLNLAYNAWEELGFLRLKQSKNKQED